MNSYQRLRNAVREYVEDALNKNPHATCVKLPEQLFRAYLRENPSGLWRVISGGESMFGRLYIRVVELAPEEEP